MLTISFGSKSLSVGRAVTVPTSPSGSASPKAPKRAKGAWKADPISPKQIGTIARMFRQLDMVHDNVVNFAGQRFVFDETKTGWNGKPGVWTGLPTTKGEAADLLDKLFAADKRFGPVETATIPAEPEVVPSAPLQRGDVVTIDGVEYRIAGKAR